MIELLPSPWGAQFERLIDRAESSLVMCAPYVGSGACERIARVLGRAGRASSVQVSLLTDLSRDNMVSGATDPRALLTLTAALPNTTIRFLPSLHAKVFVADEREAIITSSNLT